MTYIGSMNNAAHWVFDPLGADVVDVLARLRDRLPLDSVGDTRPGDRLNFAYLIARRCIKVGRNGSVVITEKGWDALAFYRREED